MTAPPETFPLSHPEQRIFLVQQMHPDSSLWNLARRVKCTGALDTVALQQALNQVVRENSGLRQRFTETANEYRKYVAEAGETPIDVLEIEGEAAFDAWAHAAARIPVWQLDAPLFRVACAAFSEQHWGVLLIAHHIVADGTGLSLVVARLMTHYQQIVNTGAIAPDSPQPSSLDYLRYEQDYLASPQCAVDRQFWLEEFAALPEALELFPDQPQPALHADRCTRVLPTALTHRIDHFCHDHQTSPYRLILAAFYLYLARISRNPDVVISTAFANRADPGLAQAVGMFVSTIPLRLEPALAEVSFAGLLNLISAKFRDIRPHERYPYDRLAQDLREQHGQPVDLLTCTLSQLQLPPPLPGVTMEFICPGELANPLLLYVAHGRRGEVDQPITLYLDYQVEAFSASRIEALLNHLLNLLSDGIDHPDRPLAHLNMLSAAEERRLLKQFNNTEADYPLEQTLYGLFELQAHRIPQQTALVYRDQRLSYAELNARANQLARQLRDRGVQPNEFVALLVDRSLDMMIGALGILKSGAAYVPIDPNYPADRIQYMIGDSQARQIVTQSHYLHLFSLNQEVINLDNIGACSTKTGDLARVNQSTDLACLIYTSGSTGNPKGVMLEHRALVNFTCGFIAGRGLTAADRIAKHASFSFDVSILEIYPTLAVGATMYIVHDDIRLNLMSLNDYYEQNGITGAFFTTQLGEQFIDLFDNRSLRFLELGGEKMRFFKPRRHRIFNGYGPTECSVYTTDFLVERSYANIPIGRPLPNYRVYILDAYNNLQPIGAPGELCVAGEALARGYWNLPDKTAAVFTENPQVPGERIYRTGDLARWLPEGHLEHLGRIDRQLKIRGFRIEPGEIEAALLHIPGIQEAAVIDFKEPNGRVALCAYLVAAEPVESAALKHTLGESLPEYMLPQYVMQIPRFPMTGSGKIDRRNLPLPQTVATAATHYVAPRNALETQVVALWQDILKLPQVGIDDHFFSIGGHSLKAALLLARMEKTVGVKVAMRDFFKTPTIRSLLDAFGGQSATTVTRIPSAPPAPHYPVTLPQKQLYVLERLEGIGTTYQIPRRFTFRGSLNTARLADALQALVDRHEALRTSFQVVDGEPVQIIAPSVRLKMRFEDASEASLPAIEQRFVRPFNLAKAPLLRALLVRTASDCHHLLLDVHHIICDGVSVGILLQELNALLNEQPLLPPSAQFKDYAVWERQFRDSPAVQAQGAFWHELFNDPQLPELPTDHPRKAAASFAGRESYFALDRDLFLDVQRLVSEAGATLHIVLLAAIHALLARYANQEDMITGTSLAGRNQDDIANTLGMFVNTVPVRTFPKAALSFREFVGQVKQTMLTIYQNQDYPLERLYETLNFRRGAGRHPLFDVNFVLRNMDMAVMELPGIVTERTTLSAHQSKFDLSIAAWEQEGTLRFELEHKAQLFNPETMARLGGHLLNLLVAATRQPDAPLGELEWLSPAERRQLLVEFNPAPTPPAPFATVVEAVERQVRELPDSHFAVVAANARLTYREFNAKANQLARQLRQRGVGADEVVGIVADRSAEVIVAMLAVLKAGGAYTAIDPKYPVDRIQHILENSGTRLLLGHSDVLHSDWPFTGERLILNDPALYVGDDANLEPVAGSAHLAYIIYTSGSTGKPKGVMIEHRSMVNFMHWYATLHDFTPADHSAAYATFSFDASVAQVWAPLISGATLHVISEDLRLSPPELNAYFEAQGVTHAHFPTQFGEQFMAMTDNHSLKRIVVGGDALRQYRLGSYRITNEYGPSETTVASTAIHVDRQFERVPIGTPAKNTRIYVLDRQQRLQPLGVPGEICIAGAGLARGYRSDPELTAQRFVADPFYPSEKMYKTGDLGRWLPDGNLEFLGRVDFQVKIRGYRIELGEIEQQLLKYPGIRQVVVTDRADENGNKYLCAYYEADADIPLGTLKQALGRELPEYMIPSFLIGLRDMPLNRNGKIDRKALPDPAFTMVVGETVMPRNEIEHLIAVAWNKVLGRSGIGVTDNFFEIGGDSLRSIALVAELQKNFEVRVNDIFTYPTIAELAGQLRPLKDHLKHRLFQIQDAVAARRERMYALAEDPEFQDALRRYQERNRDVADFEVSTRRAYRQVLLTGATGYLGAWVLAELWQTRDCHITALVRAADSTKAQERLRQQINSYFGPEFYQRYQGRITVLAADLSQNRLGLSEAEYAALAEQMDCIVHSAANVRHYGLYEEFYAANVQATENLLELAATGPRKDFHHVSTTSVGAGQVAGRDWIVFTEHDVAVGQAPKNLYVRTKLEGEQRVVAARERGVMTNIYRAGNVCFDSRTGRFQDNIEDNAFYQQVKSYANLGAVPDEGDERNLSFVDQSAKALVTLFDCAGLRHQIFHLSNPHRVKLSALLTAPNLGVNVAVKTFPHFLDDLGEHFDHPGFRAPIEQLMLHQGWLDFDPNQPQTACLTRSERSDAILERLGFIWPRPEPEQMRPMVLTALRQRREFLHQMPALALLEPMEIDGLALRGRPVWLDAEMDIIQEGEENAQVYALVDGYLEVSRRSREGWVGSIRLLRPGELIGKEALLHQLPSPVNIETLDGACLLAFDAEELRRFLAGSPRLALGLAKTLSHWVNQLEMLYVDVG